MGAQRPELRLLLWGPKKNIEKGCNRLTDVMGVSRAKVTTTVARKLGITMF